MPHDLESTLRRVRAIRQAYSRSGETARDFAKRLGFTETAWNNYEKTQRPGLDAGIRIVEQFPELTLDWLYLGDSSSLRFDTREELLKAEASLSPSLETTKSAGRTAGAGSAKLTKSSISRQRAKTRRA